jgi:hypothetical protein
MPIYVFWHVATMGNWREVVEEQADLLRSSGLADVCSGINIVKIGPEPWVAPHGMQIIQQVSALKYYEYPTLNLLHKHAQSNNALYLYMHTKGVSKTIDDWDRHEDFYLNSCNLKSYSQLFNNEKQWREYMQYFMIENYKVCIKGIAGNDVVGVSWRETPFRHAPGNFWWATSKYIRTLDDPYATVKCYRDKRGGAEAWIGIKAPKVYCPHYSPNEFYSQGISKRSYARIKFQ